MNGFFANNGFRAIDRKNFTKEEITFSNAWGVADEDLYNKVII
jgi:phosphoglycerol transferase MdoB-like AlkP superfamily enzyme